MHSSSSTSRTYNKYRKPMVKKKINLNEALKKYFGFDKFKGDQEAIVQNVLDGKNTFVLMPTGGGKSLCYQLPSLLLDGTAIVISPLIALMKNQVDVISAMSEEGTAHYLNSSLNKSAIDQVKDDVKAGRTKLLYVAPESLTKEENVEFLKQAKISFYAIDEAHCISEWGHDFRPEYRRIRPIINEIGNAPIIALTATATDKVRTDIKKNLAILDADEFKSSFNRPNLYYEVRPKTKDVDKDIIKFIKQHPGKSGIIYCLSRKKVEELAEILRANDIKAQAYHAGLDSTLRSQTQDDFLMEKIDVIVATIAFGMGIDKPDVRFVIHYDIPKSLEGYIRRRVVPVVMGARVSVWPSIRVRIWINWRNSWKANLLPSKILDDNCWLKRLHTLRQVSVEGRCCCIISVRLMRRITVATVTTVCIRRRR